MFLRLVAGHGLMHANQVPLMPGQPSQISDIRLLEERCTGVTCAQVEFAGSIPVDWHADFKNAFRANFGAFLRQYQASVLFGSLLVYLEGPAMDGKEKRRVLQALIATAQKTAKQLGSPELASPTLQMHNSLYTLTASGCLHRRHCKQQPQLLSARVVAGPSAQFTSSQYGGQHSTSWRLVAIAADA